MAGGEVQDYDDEQARPYYPSCSCGEEITNRQWNHCPACGKEISGSDFNTNPIGTWEVTTENDCEGRTTKTLGVYEGHVVDIARNLGPQAYYGLTFRKLKVSKTMKAGAAINSAVRVHVYPQLSLSSLSFDTTKRNVEITTDGPGAFSLKFK